MIKNVIFDLGGVVIDWNPDKVFNTYTGDKNLPQTLFNNGFFDQWWVNFDRGTMTQSEIVDKMADYCSYSKDECAHFVEFVKYSLVDIPKTIHLMKELSDEGYNLYCLSNMSAEFYDYLKVRNFFHLFKGQIISAHEQLVKPEKEIYQLLLNRFELKPEECLFIDDLKNNVIAAEAQGITTVHFADKEKGYKEINRILKRSTVLCASCD